MSQLGADAGTLAGDAPAGPMTLRLREGSVTPEGRRLGLVGGEVLVSVNGAAFTGGETALTARLLMRRGKPLALTFAREGGNLLVLAGTTALGRWEQVPALPAPEGDPARIDPDRLRNYEVMRGPEGQYDLYSVEVPLIAVIAPPLWLFQMRVWAPGATLLAGLAAAAIVSPWLSLVVWLSAALWIRGAALPLLRADRQMRGLSFAGVVAARGESEAHAIHQARSPGDRCIFCAQKEQAAQTA